MNQCGGTFEAVVPLDPGTNVIVLMVADRAGSGASAHPPATPD
jgi:hypothetical protein